jgi:hypothetical protein
LIWVNAVLDSETYFVLTLPVYAADEFPNAEVEGTDLSPVQPLYVPSNVKFVIDDASEEDWLYPPNHFDYIHSRVLIGAFSDFRSIIVKSLLHLKPGGYMECQEIHFTVYCDDGTMPDDWAFKEWCRYNDKAAMNVERPLRIANKLKKWFQDTGFEDVHEEVFKMPVNPWPKDPHYKQIGRWWEVNLLDGLQAFSLGRLHRGLKWTREEIEVGFHGRLRVSAIQLLFGLMMLTTTLL